MTDSRHDFGRKPDKRRSKKLNARVDLTAMVSISFLLIIFFMVTVELSKPQSLSFGVPQSACGPIGCPMGDGRTLTLLLDDHNKIISYLSFLSTPLENPKELKYGKEGIRKELLSLNKQIVQTTGDPRKGLIVVIKPSKKSNFANLVDILK